MLPMFSSNPLQHSVLVAYACDMSVEIALVRLTVVCPLWSPLLGSANLALLMFRFDEGGTNFAARSGVEIRSRSTIRVIEKQC